MPTNYIPNTADSECRLKTLVRLHTHTHTHLLRRPVKVTVTQDHTHSYISFTHRRVQLFVFMLKVKPVIHESPVTPDGIDIFQKLLRCYDVCCSGCQTITNIF